MREILFRGKRIGNGEWVEGYLICDEYCNTDIPYIGYLLGDDTDVAEVDPATIGQYTGLTDKSGKKIFEGDILEIYLENVPVIYSEENGVWFVRFGNGEEPPLNEFDRQNIKIIGNIHDNPELLEVNE